MTEQLINRDQFEVCCRNWPWYRMSLKGYFSFSFLLLEWRRLCNFPITTDFSSVMEMEFPKMGATLLRVTARKKRFTAPQEKECILHSFPDERKLWFHTDLESFHLQMWQIYVYKKFSSQFPDPGRDLHFMDHFKDNSTYQLTKTHKPAQLIFFFFKNKIIITKLTMIVFNFM